MSAHVCAWPGPPDRAGQAWACPVCGARYRAARDAFDPGLVRWVRDDDRPGLDTTERVRL